MNNGSRNGTEHSYIQVQYSTLLEVVQLHLTPGPITNGVTMIESILKYRIMAEVVGLL